MPLEAPPATYSGLSACQRRIRVAANNIANVSTDGFKKSRAVLSTVQPRGVKAEVEQARQPGQARWSKRLKVTSL